MGHSASEEFLFRLESYLDRRAGAGEKKRSAGQQFPAEQKTAEKGGNEEWFS